MNATKAINYNITCSVTGKSDNLRMHAIRDNNDNIIGWLFLNESVNLDGCKISVDIKFEKEPTRLDLTKL
jgi:hypothetical protein